jgi:diguanylate cyclase (GGDEF)-like protein
LVEDDPPTLFVTQRSRAAPGRLVPTLTVLEGPEIGAFFVLGPDLDEHVIGRGEDAELRIQASSVSRHHAVCRVFEEDGRPRVEVRDNGSTNGVLVNGGKVQAARLISGDKVRLGDVLLRFEWMPEAETAYHSDVSMRIRAAERDHLTGLLSRVFLVDRVPDLLADVDRRHGVISAVMVDLDHFKRVNDTHGHLVGDEVLRRAANFILLEVGREEPAIRYGGEEILVLLPFTDGLAAERRAEGWRTAIAGAPMGDVATSLRITASFGVTERAQGEALDTWLKRADQALYLAKHRGRNQVCVADVPGDSERFTDTMPRRR